MQSLAGQVTLARHEAKKEDREGDRGEGAWVSAVQRENTQIVDRGEGIKSLSSFRQHYTREPAFCQSAKRGEREDRREGRG